MQCIWHASTPCCMGELVDVLHTFESTLNHFIYKTRWCFKLGDLGSKTLPDPKMNSLESNPITHLYQSFGNPRNRALLRPSSGCAVQRHVSCQIKASFHRSVYLGFYNQNSHGMKSF